MDEIFATCKLTEGVNVLHMRLTLRESLMNNLWKFACNTKVTIVVLFFL